MIIPLLMVVITIQAQLLDGFPPPWLPLCQLGFMAFHIYAKKKFQQKKV